MNTTKQLISKRIETPLYGKIFFGILIVESLFYFGKESISQNFILLILILSLIFAYSLLEIEKTESTTKIIF